jgi:hypothetical protein
VRASVNEVVEFFEPPVCDARLEISFLREQQVRLGRILLIGAVAGILLAHAIVLYKIDTGVRSSDVKAVMASRSHRAFW